METLLLIFFDWQGVIHKEFVPEGETIHAVYYKGVMERLLNRIQRVRPGMREYGDWFLLHDNAPSHNAIIVKQFLAQGNVTVLDHPPYSPDLAPADYFCSQKWNPTWSSVYLTRFRISRCHDKYIKYHCKDDFYKAIQKLYDRSNLCTVGTDVYRKLNNESVISFR